jgi:hypothetical protein
VTRDLPVLSVREDRRRSLLLVLLGVVMVVGSTYVLWLGLTGREARFSFLVMPSWVVAVLGVIAIAFFGLALVIYVARALSGSGEILRADAAGLGGSIVGRLRWDEIDAIGIVGIGGSLHGIGILPRQGVARRGGPIEALNRQLTGYPIVIEERRLDRPLDEVLGILIAYLEPEAASRW